VAAACGQADFAAHCSGNELFALSDRDWTQWLMKALRKPPGHGSAYARRVGVASATFSPKRVALVGVHSWSDDDFPNVAEWGIQTFEPDGLTSAEVRRIVADVNGAVDIVGFTIAEFIPPSDAPATSSDRLPPDLWNHGGLTPYTMVG
jgi:hypothetical protein